MMDMFHMFGAKKTVKSSRFILKSQEIPFYPLVN